MTTTVRIGANDAEHLTINVLHREQPGSDDYWDGNWVISEISVAVGAFVGLIRSSLRMEEIHRFNEGLKFIDQNLFGTAVLDSMEDWITLTVKADSRGQLEVVGKVGDTSGAGNLLQFEITNLDQTYLSGWISDLNDIEKAFPVVGRP